MSSYPRALANARWPLAKSPADAQAQPAGGPPRCPGLRDPQGLPDRVSIAENLFVFAPPTRDGPRRVPHCCKSRRLPTLAARDRTTNWMNLERPSDRLLQAIAHARTGRDHRPARRDRLTPGTVRPRIVPVYFADSICTPTHSSASVFRLHVWRNSFMGGSSP